MNHSTPHAVSDFIELYFSTDLPKKEVELLKVKALAASKTPDPLEQTIHSFRKALHLGKKHHEKIRSKTIHEKEQEHNTLHELSPEDFLIVIARKRYGISSETLSLILKTPVDSLRFREDHLIERLKVHDEDIKNLHLKFRIHEKKGTTHFQSLKHKIRPQRFIWESSIIMALILFLLWSIPSLKKRYDLWVERKTNEYFILQNTKDSPIPEEFKTKETSLNPEINTTEEPAIQEPQLKTERKQPKVSEGEVWRFSFNGYSKENLNEEIKEALQNYTEQTVKSSVAPGGTQYDAFVKTDDLISLKMKLESFADAHPSTLKMSWYKKKNMGGRKIPTAHVEVLIWISTI